MTTRLLIPKGGVSNSILSKNITSSSFRRYPQRQLSIVTFAKHNDASKHTAVQLLSYNLNNNLNNNNNNNRDANCAKTRGIHQRVCGLSASINTSASSTLKNSQSGGGGSLHHRRHHHNNKTDTTITTTTTTPGKACTCPDCRWFPFHKGTLPNLLSDTDLKKIDNFMVQMSLHTVSFSGNPFDISHYLVQRLAYEQAQAQAQAQAQEAKASSAEGGGGGGGGGEGGKDNDGGTGSQDKKDQDDDDDDDDYKGDKGDGDKMPRSGYDTTNMREAQKDPRPAGSEGCGSSGGGDRSEEEDENRNRKEGGDHPDDHGRRGPEPLEVKEERPDNIDDIRLPLEGRGWTFWL